MADLNKPANEQANHAPCSEGNKTLDPIDEIRVQEQSLPLALNSQGSIVNHRQVHPQFESKEDYNEPAPEMYGRVKYIGKG